MNTIDVRAVGWVVPRCIGSEIARIAPAGRGAIKTTSTTANLSDLAIASLATS